MVFVSIFALLIPWVQICSAQEASVAFINNLLTTHDYSLSPSGKHLLVKERAPNKAGYSAIYLRRISEAPSQAASRAGAKLQLADAWWTARTDNDELFGLRNGNLYKADLERNHRYTLIKLPKRITGISVRHLPRTDQEPLTISGIARKTRKREVYRCHRDSRAETTCTSIAEYTRGTEKHVFDQKGDVVARFQWDPYHLSLVHFQVRDIRVPEGWRSVYSYTPAETAFRLLTRPDEDGNVFALSNRGKEMVALVRFNIQSGKETVVSEHEHDISEVFRNDYTPEILATSSFPGLQTLRYRLPSLERSLHRVLKEIEAPRRIHLLSTDYSSRSFVVRIQSAAVGYLTVLLHPNETYELLDQRDDPLPYQTGPYASPQPILIHDVEGPALRGLLTRPSGEPAPSPFVIMIHGGPRSQYRWSMHPLVQRLASLGIAVLQLNYRGSSGYGRQYERFLLEGHQPFESIRRDVQIAYDWLLSNGIGKRGRAALWGDSMGATVAVLAASERPERYPVVVSLGGLFDFRMFIEYAMREVARGRRGRLADWNRYLGVSPDLAIRQQMRELLKRGETINPCGLATGLRSSVLLFAGKTDAVAHPQQSLALHKELRARGVESRLRLLNHSHKIRNRGVISTIMAESADIIRQKLLEESDSTRIETRFAGNSRGKSGCLVLRPDTPPGKAEER